MSTFSPNILPLPHPPLFRTSLFFLPLQTTSVTICWSAVSHLHLSQEILRQGSGTGDHYISPLTPSDTANSKDSVTVV